MKLTRFTPMAALVALVSCAQPTLQDRLLANDKAIDEVIAKMSLEERREFLQKEMIEKPLDLTPTTNRAFRTGTEQVMSWIFTTDLGSMPPPLPRISIRDEAHIMEILDAPNPIFEGDSDRAKDAKEMVALAKEELRKFLDERFPDGYDLSWIEDGALPIAISIGGQIFNGGTVRVDLSVTPMASAWSSLPKIRHRSFSCMVSGSTCRCATAPEPPCGSGRALRSAAFALCHGWHFSRPSK